MEMMEVGDLDGDGMLNYEGKQSWINYTCTGHYVKHRSGAFEVNCLKIFTYVQLKFLDKIYTLNG